MEQHHKANIIAKYLGVDTRTVKKACELGELEYLKVAGVITIPESAIEAYRQGSKSRQNCTRKETESRTERVGAKE